MPCHVLHYVTREAEAFLVAVSVAIEKSLVGCCTPGIISTD